MTKWQGVDCFEQQVSTHQVSWWGGCTNQTIIDTMHQRASQAVMRFAREFGETPILVAAELRLGVSSTASINSVIRLNHPSSQVEETQSPSLIRAPHS